VDLLERRIPFPEPEDPTHMPGEAESARIGSFNPDGTLR
jgi:hypothetical protein